MKLFICIKITSYPLSHICRFVALQNKLNMNKVEELIAKHAARLREHRHALDGPSQGNNFTPPTSRPNQEISSYDYHDRHPFTEDEPQQDEPTDQHDQNYAIKDSEALHNRKHRLADGSDHHLFHAEHEHQIVLREEPVDQEHYVVSSNTGMYNRSLRWKMQRERALDRQREAEDEQAFYSSSFHPKISQSAHDGSISRSLVAQPIVTTPQATAAVYQFIQRQKAARREKEERSRRGFVDGSGWTGKTTVFQEFKFNQGDGQPITALRKPVIPETYMMAVRSQLDDLDTDHRDDAEFCPTEDGAPRAPLHPLHSNIRSKSTSVSTDQRGSSNESNTSTEKTDSFGKKNDESAEKIKDLELKIAERDEEVIDLKSTLLLMQRELEAAKIKIRQLALAQTNLSE